MGIELCLGQYPAFFQQQLLQGQQMEFVGISQGTVEIEQQGFKHARDPMQGPLIITRL
ncbi:hypothetical protein D3C72_2180910 [compost metagenome]